MKALNMISVLVIILITAMLFASCGTTATPAEATQKANETTALPTGAKPTTAATESATAAPTAQTPATEPTPTEAPQEQPQNTYEQPNYEVEQSGDLQMTISGTPVSVEWEDNEAVQALKELCKDQPLTIAMSMYGGFEQVGSIGTALPQDDVQTTTSAGDIVLYSGDQMVVFYGSNTWAYTRLGHISDKTPEELNELLSIGDVTVTLSY